MDFNIGNSAGFKNLLLVLKNGRKERQVLAEVEKRTLCDLLKSLNGVRLKCLWERRTEKVMKSMPDATVLRDCLTPKSRQTDK